MLYPHKEFILRAFHAPSRIYFSTPIISVSRSREATALLCCICPRSSALRDDTHIENDIYVCVCLLSNTVSQLLIGKRCLNIVRVY